MKHQWIVAATLIMLSGCQKEETFTQTNFIPKVITASFEQGNGSRIAISEEYALSWTDDDELAVVDATDYNYFDNYLLKEGAGSSNGVFELNEEEYGPSVISSPAFVFYPYITFAGGDPSTGFISFEYNATSYAQKLPMIGKLDTNGHISFKHLGGVLYLHITNVPDGYKYVQIQSSNRIAGYFKANITNEKPVLEHDVSMSSGQQYASINMSHDDDGDWISYLSLPVGDYESLSVSLTGGGSTKELKSWNNLKIERAKIYTATLAADE